MNSISSGNYNSECMCVCVCIYRVFKLQLLSCVMKENGFSCQDERLLLKAKKKDNEKRSILKNCRADADWVIVHSVCKINRKLFFTSFYVELLIAFWHDFFNDLCFVVVSFAAFSRMLAVLVVCCCRLIVLSSILSYYCCCARAVVNIAIIFLLQFQFSAF